MTIINRDEAKDLFSGMDDILNNSALSNEQKHKAIFSDTLASKLSEALLTTVEVSPASDKSEIAEFHTRCRLKLEYLLELDADHPYNTEGVL